MVARCYLHPDRAGTHCPVWPANQVRGGWVDHELVACPGCAVDPQHGYRWVELESAEFWAAFEQQDRK